MTARTAGSVHDESGVKVLAVVVPALALALGLAGVPTLHAAVPDAIRAGARDYQHYCASCHGVKGRGDGPVAGAFRVMPANLTVLQVKNAGVFPADQVREIIDGRKDVAAHGPRTMPAWGLKLYETPEGVGQRQARDRIQAITEYLRTIQTGE